MKLIMKVKCKEIAGRLTAKPELTESERATYEMTQSGGSVVCSENLAEIIAWYR